MPVYVSPYRTKNKTQKTMTSKAESIKMLGIVINQSL